MRPSRGGARIAKGIILCCLVPFLSLAAAQQRSKGGDIGRVAHVSASKVGGAVAIAEQEGRVIIWNAALGKAEHVLDVLGSGRRSEAPRSIKVIDEGERIALVTMSGHVFVWHHGTGRIARRWRLWEDEYRGAMRADAASVSGELRVLAHGQGVAVYAGREDLLRLRAFPAELSDFSMFSPSGRLILIIAGDGHGTFIEERSGRTAARIKLPVAVTSAAFSPDERYIATGTFSGEAEAWEVTSGQRLTAFPGPQPIPPPGFYDWRSRGPYGPHLFADHTVNALSFTPDGKQIAVARGKEVRIFEFPSGREVRTLNTGARVTAIAFTRQKALVIGTENGALIAAVTGSIAGISLSPREWATLQEREAQRRTESDCVFDAMNEGDRARVVAALESGCDLHLRNEEGATPLWVAAARGQLEVVKELLRRGAAVDARGIAGSTPLAMAAQHGHADVVQELMVAGANVNLQDTFGGTPLQWAAYGGHASVVTLLLQSGAKADLARKSGETALSMARTRGHTEIVRLLMEAASRR